MLHRLILKVTKFKLPPPERLGTVVKNILGGMSNRVKLLLIRLRKLKVIVDNYEMHR